MSRIPFKTRDLAAAQRFWAKVDRRDATVCWPWLASTDGHNYGQFTLPGSRLVRAHRVAWFLTNGDPGEAVVRHLCDNPPCCNPAHLQLGSQKDNIHDCMDRGRDVHVVGERNGKAKLSSSAVIEIRQLRRSGLSHGAIGRRFAVSADTIAGVLSGRTWRHVGGAQ